LALGLQLFTTEIPAVSFFLQAWNAESHSPFDLPILVSSDLAFAHFVSASDLRVSMAARPLQISAPVLLVIARKSVLNFSVAVSQSSISVVSSAERPLPPHFSSIFLEQASSVARTSETEGPEELFPLLPGQDGASFFPALFPAFCAFLLALTASRK